MPNAISKRYTLTNGENTYSSPAATNEADARKLQSLIPSLSGQLERERPTIPFTNDAAFPSRVGFFHTFKHNNNGTIVFYFFCATATALYQLINPGPSQFWQEVLPLGGFPVAVNINNTMHVSDGVVSYIFDGFAFVVDGLPIPLHAPAITVNAAPPTNAITSITRVNGVVTILFAAVQLMQRITIAGVADLSFNGTFLIDIDNSAGSIMFNQPGLPDSAPGAGGTVSNASFTVLVNRFYWTTYADTTSTHPHESSSSPTSVGTGPITNQNVTVQQRAGSVSIANGSNNVVGVGTDFSQDDVGKFIYLDGTRHITIPNHFVAQSWLIASVQDAQHLTIVGPTTGASTTGNFIIAPPRASGWNVYASASETDQLGNLLATIGPFIGAGGTVQSTYLDQSPMIGTVGAYFQSVQRPLLNDPTNPSTIMEVHKNRIWRNLVPKFPNFFTYTGYEEVLAEQAGTPSETVPGVVGPDGVTRSPSQINETSYPDQSSVITGLRKHGDALYIGSELNIIPLYGSSLADFQLSESQAFAVGLAGRRASCSTPFGLAFVSYDLKVYLYPSQYSFGVDSTTALVELGRPKRPEFETIDGADLAQVGLIFYNWGRRNWLVLNYRKTDQTFATWVFDFEVKGWFQLQQGYTAIGVFETTLGRKSLMGAGTDNKVYVIDDLTGNFPVAPGTNYPVGYYRILLDYTDPNSFFINKLIAYEISDKSMEVDVTFWMDPVDPENPGVGIPVQMTKSDLGANRFTGRPNADTGATCQRILIEFAIAAGPSSGTFRGFTAEATPIPSPRL